MKSHSNQIEWWSFQQLIYNLLKRIKRLDQQFHLSIFQIGCDQLF